jgi:endonuclease G
MLAAAQANFTQEQLARIERNCPLGRPRLDPDFGFGPTRFVIRRGYVLEHSSRDRIPLWVCERISPAQVGGSETRVNAFQADPELPVGERAELSDYRGSGYDRGHMAPAGDQTTDASLKRETFYLSNMAPQKARLNREIWAALEDSTRQWLQRRGGGYVITGGLFYDPKEESPTTADGLIPYFQIGIDLVAVPTHFYKIIVTKDAANHWHAIAFVLENRAYPRPFQLAQFIRSVDWVEERAGIDVMPDLPAADEPAVESATPALWH